MTVPIRIGLAVERLAQRDGAVSVDFSDGTSGTYDLVVGADGIHSAVRRLAFEPTAVPRPVGQIGWRFLAPRPREVTTWSVMLGRRTAFLTIPIAGDRVYCYCDVVSPPDHDTPEVRSLPALLPSNPLLGTGLLRPRPVAVAHFPETAQAHRGLRAGTGVRRASATGSEPEPGCALAGFIPTCPTPTSSGGIAIYSCG